MTKAQIIEAFGNIIDQEGNNPMDDVFTGYLLNMAKNKLEGSRDWEYLKKKATLNTTTLPTDFISPINVKSGRYQIPFVPFDDYELYQEGVYIDQANSAIHVLGSYTETPIMTYKKLSDDLTNDSDSPIFPARFHLLLAYEMAEIYQSGIDGDDLNFRMSQRHRLEHQTIKQSMESWDNDLKMASMNDRQKWDDLQDSYVNPITLQGR